MTPTPARGMVWRAWGVQLMYDPTDPEWSGRGSGEDCVRTFDTRRDARDEADDYPPARVFRVEIREVKPKRTRRRGRK